MVGFNLQNNISRKDVAGYVVGVDNLAYLVQNRSSIKQKENKMKTYEVSLSLDASVTVEVTAENEGEAEKKAIEKFYNKDLDHVDADHYYEMHLLNDHYVTEVEA